MKQIKKGNPRLQFYCFEANSIYMPPKIRMWCRENFGYTLVSQYKKAHDIKNSSYGEYLIAWAFDDEMINKSRWFHESERIYIKTSEDAMMFRLFWCDDSVKFLDRP